MKWVERLTPKNTEEIKPNLFIQNWYAGGRGKHYRQIYPAAWDGKIIWKNLIFGHGFLKSTIVFFIILLIAFGYYDSTKQCNEFEKDPCKYLPNITRYCFEQRGIRRLVFGDLKNGGEENKGSDTDSLSSYP